MRLRAATALALAAFTGMAQACEEGTVPLFGCQAAGGRKFIELCASAPVTEDGTLQYRFGSLDRDGREKQVELVYPASTAGSMKQFFGATYTHQGAYTQSIRFTTGPFGYRVYTTARGPRDEDAGVEVRHVATGKVTTVSCSERPRFYIHELAGKLQCDSETPVGKACIK